MAQKYSIFQKKLKLMSKKELIETINKTKSYLENFYQSKNEIKFDEIPSIVKQSDINKQLSKKCLIEIYTSFELSYLQHTKKLREEIKKRKVELKEMLDDNKIIYAEVD